MSELHAPAEIGWLADLVGAACALQIIELHGGTRLKVPADPNQGSALAREIGLEATRALAAAYGGEQVKIPLLKWWRARVYRADGLSYAAGRAHGAAGRADGRIGPGRGARHAGRAARPR